MIAVQDFGPFTMPAGMIVKGVLQAHTGGVMLKSFCRKNVSVRKNRKSI